MRLTESQKNTMKTLVCAKFGADARVRLFGSRLWDNRRGGDYDFMVETSLANPDELIERKLALLVALDDTPDFADEKIDIVLHCPLHTKMLDIQKAAYKEGQEL